MVLRRRYIGVDFALKKESWDINASIEKQVK